MHAFRIGIDIVWSKNVYFSTDINKTVWFGRFGSFSKIYNTRTCGFRSKKNKINIRKPRCAHNNCTVIYTLHALTRRKRAGWLVYRPIKAYNILFFFFFSVYFFLFSFIFIFLFRARLVFVPVSVTSVTVAVSTATWILIAKGSTYGSSMSDIPTVYRYTEVYRLAANVQVRVYT